MYYHPVITLDCSTGIEADPDPFYFNVCVDYKYRYSPIPYEEIQKYYQDCLDKGLLQPIPDRRRENERTNDVTEI